MYFFWMLVASGLGFLKVMALAQIMSPENLGTYLSIIGVAVLSGTVLSLGQIEGTTKYYPRLWLLGDHERILASVRIIAAKLAIRFLVAALLSIVALTLFEVNNAALMVISAAGIGLCSAYLALAASLLRAAEHPRALQSFNLVRNGSAILLASGAGALWGWQGALCGDLLAALASLAQVTFSLSKIIAENRASEVHRDAKFEDVQKTGGGKLYLAYLFSSATLLLDRGAINLALGAAAAGNYGIVALMFQVGQLVINIFAQRAGPRIIKSAQTSGIRSGRIESVRKPIIGMFLLAVAVATAAFAAKATGLPPGFFEKYDLSWQILALGGAVCFMQIFSLLEFHLIAQDREDGVLLASGVSTGTLVLLFGASWLSGGPLEWFVASVLLSRTLHVALLWRLINVRRSR